MNFNIYDYAIKPFRDVIEYPKVISFRCKEYAEGEWYLISVTNGHVEILYYCEDESFKKWVSDNYNDLSNLGNVGLYGIWSAKNNSFSLLFSSNNIKEGRDGRKIFYDNETMNWIHNIVPNLSIVSWCSSIVSNISIGSHNVRYKNCNHINGGLDPDYYEKQRRFVMDSIRNSLYDKKKKPQKYICILDSSSLGANGSNEYAFHITRKGNKIKTY